MADPLPDEGFPPPLSERAARRLRAVAAAVALAAMFLPGGTVTCGLSFLLRGGSFSPAGVTLVDALRVRGGLWETSSEWPPGRFRASDYAFAVALGSSVILSAAFLGAVLLGRDELGGVLGGLAMIATAHTGVELFAGDLEGTLGFGAGAAFGSAGVLLLVVPVVCWRWRPHAALLVQATLGATMVVWMLRRLADGVHFYSWEYEPHAGDWMALGGWAGVLVATLAILRARTAAVWTLADAGRIAAVLFQLSGWRAASWDAGVGAAIEIPLSIAIVALAWRTYRLRGGGALLAQAAVGAIWSIRLSLWGWCRFAIVWAVGLFHTGPGYWFALAAAALWTASAYAASRPRRDEGGTLPCAGPAPV